MSDGHVCAYQRWMSGRVIRAVVADVDDGAVLHVAAGTNLDVVNIATDDRLWPHRDVIAKDDVTNDGAGWIDVYGTTQLRCLVQEWADRVHEHSRWMRRSDAS